MTSRWYPKIQFIEESKFDVKNGCLYAYFNFWYNSIYVEDPLTKI